MGTSLYYKILKEYGFNDTRFFDHVKSYIHQNLKAHDDIKSHMDHNDVASVATNIVIELMEREGDYVFGSIEQVNSYLNAAVRNAVSKYLTEVISPMKIVNPKGGQSKKDGPALTQAVNARRATIELDRDDLDKDYIPIIAEEFEQEIDVALDFEPSSNILKPFIDRSIAAAKFNQFSDLLARADSTDASAANSLLTKCIAEKMRSFNTSNDSNVLETSMFLNKIVPGLKNQINPKKELDA